MSKGITIIGLGPNDHRLWTLAAAEILTQSPEIYARTAHHPSLTHLSATVHGFDDLLAQTNSLEAAGEQLAAQIVRLGRRAEGVVYAVPGHPVIDDVTVPFIQRLAQTSELPVTVIPGLSLLETAQDLLSVQGQAGWQIVSAAEIAGLHHPPLAPDRPGLVTRLYSQNLAAAVKQTLGNAYADEFEIILLDPIDGSQQPCPLSRLDKQTNFNLQTMLYLPADPANASFVTFQETIAHLRAPDGCPWDREQTHQSLRPFLLEEAYEVLEALDTGDTAGLAEEMGDLLLQIVLHTQIAIDTGEFNMGHVIDHINRKLLRRHPHVFGDVEVNSVDDVTTNWETIKKAEKAARGQTDQIPSALDGVPQALPALTQALTISKRAVKMGFEWPNIEGVLDQLIEEAHEITMAESPEHLEAEIGDLLFSAVNLARWRKIDPESALRGTNARYRWRFQKMEQLAAAQGKNLPDLSTDDMEILWNEAKAYERQTENG